jgi:hypothetical protein
MEDPEINPCSYIYLTFNKGTENTGWRKESLFNKWRWGN